MKNLPEVAFGDHYRDLNLMPTEIKASLRTVGYTIQNLHISLVINGFDQVTSNYHRSHDSCIIMCRFLA